jgi:Sulfotransferase family
MVYLLSATLELPERFSASTDEVLRRAYASYVGEHDANKAAPEDKLQAARRYDVPGMTRVATICHWGRSGSLLLASYLDSHPELVVMPFSTSESIYPFFEEYAALSIWEKLIVYPTYSASHKKSEGDFFLRDNPSGDFAIGAAAYYEAVNILFGIYADARRDWLESRRAFFQLVYAAYGVAIGACPENPRPAMIHAQHYLNEELAKRLSEDFPGAKFMHTIRDPITGIDSWFDRKVDMESYGCNYRIDLSPRYLDTAVGAMLDLLAWDGGHTALGDRTRAIRFEDMHVAPDALMRRIADWLGIVYRPCLIESTWNGDPYVVTIRGVPACGANPANAQRRSRNLNVADRLLMFALLHDNFVAWDYPYPKAMNRRWLRLCTIALLWLVPMKIEALTARLVLLGQALPGLRRGRVGFALAAPLFVLKRRFRMMWLIAREARRRVAGKHVVMKLV